MYLGTAVDHLANCFVNIYIYNLTFYQYQCCIGKSFTYLSVVHFWESVSLRYMIACSLCRNLHFSRVLCWTKRKRYIIFTFFTFVSWVCTNKITLAKYDVWQRYVSFWYIIFFIFKLDRSSYITNDKMFITWQRTDNQNKMTFITQIILISKQIIGGRNNSIN